MIILGGSKMSPINDYQSQAYEGSHEYSAPTTNQLASNNDIKIVCEMALVQLQQMLNTLKGENVDNQQFAVGSLNDIGMVYYEQSQYDKALLLENIGTIYYTEGEYRKALEYYKDGLIVCRKIVSDAIDDTTTLQLIDSFSKKFKERCTKKPFLLSLHPRNWIGVQPTIRTAQPVDPDIVDRHQNLLSCILFKCR